MASDAPSAPPFTFHTQILLARWYIPLAVARASRIELAVKVTAGRSSAAHALQHVTP